MKNDSMKKIAVYAIALAFITTGFLPVVQSRLGTARTTTEPTTLSALLNTYNEILKGTNPTPSPAPIDDAPMVHLPTSPVTLKVFSSTTSYFRTQLSDVPAGYEVTNKNYTGWCSDFTHYINYNTAYQVTLYSSYDQNLPAPLYHQNWSKVNYILNHKIGTNWNQVQDAIFYILDFGNQGLTANGWTMVNDSILYGGSYTPGCGDLIAIIADAGTSVQRTIFELVVPTYTLTLDTDGDGTITADPDKPGYSYDQVVSLTANPALGWSFDHWSGDASGTDPVTTVSMDGNKTVTAHFTQDVYTLTINVDPLESGTVDIDPSGPYHYGDVVTLTAAPNPGYSFDHWTGDASGTSVVTTVTMNDDKTVTGVFTLNEYSLSITMDPIDAGAVDADPSGPYHYGDIVTLTATENPGYTFDHWEGDASGSSYITTVSMDADKTVTAVFTQNIYTLTVTVDPVDGGTVDIAPSGPYYYGDIVTLTADATPGYSFDHWTGDASGSSYITTVIMDADKTVNAVFTQDVYTLLISVDPAAGGTVNAVPGGPYYYGDVVTLTAVANPGYSFDHWTGDASGSNPVTTVTMYGDRTVVAHFTQNTYTLTITVDPVEGGIVQSAPAPPYYYNDVVTLTAISSPGYSFDHWSGDASGTSPVTTVTMNDNKAVTAHFTQNEYTLTVIVDPEAGGSVNISPAPPYHYGDVVMLTATANHDYAFDHWSGDVSGTNSVINTTIDGNKSVTATFIFIGDVTPPTVKITTPENAVYLFGRMIMPFDFPIIIQSITIEADASDNQSGVNHVDFFIDDVLKGNDTTAPYTYDWQEVLSGKHAIKVIAYDNAGHNATAAMSVIKWRFHPVITLMLIPLLRAFIFWEKVWTTYHHPPGA